jgi:hypothetical protein
MNQIINVKVDNNLLENNNFKEGCDPDHYVRIFFNLNDSRIDIKKIIKIVNVFREMGIVFEIENNSKERIWEFDSSLKGPISIFVNDFFYSYNNR